MTGGTFVVRLLLLLEISQLGPWAEAWVRAVRAGPHLSHGDDSRLIAAEGPGLWLVNKLKSIDLDAIWVCQSSYSCLNELHKRHICCFYIWTREDVRFWSWFVVIVFVLRSKNSNGKRSCPYDRENWLSNHHSWILCEPSQTSVPQGCLEREEGKTLKGKKT